MGWRMLLWIYMNRSDFDSTFFVLDFDRCIGDTDKMRRLLWHIIESETTIHTDELEAARKTMEANGFQFDVVEYAAREMLRRKSKVTWLHIQEVFVAAVKSQNVLEPGAAELLDKLDERRIPYGILTYGKQAWQLAKLKASGLVDRGVRFEITQIEHKGEILTGWREGDEFIVPPALTPNFQPLHVRHIVFLDDKPRSFVGIPMGVYGICVRPVAYSPRPSQQGELPDGVDTVLGIRGAVKLLFGENT